MWQRWRFWLWLVMLGMILAAPTRSDAAVTAQVDVYTMGPGDDLFSRFGHAAICVTDEESPLGRCYNYGTADFSTPGPLTWGVLRGHGRFWVSVVSQPRMMAIYHYEDRTVYRQRLPLSPSQTTLLIQLLHKADRPEQTLYNYRHFDDNCTTRIRDLVDAVTDGALHRQNQIANQPSLRHHVVEGFATAPVLLALQQAVLGRRVDAPITGWDSMFLPDVLRAELQDKLHTPPEVAHARTAPIPPRSALPPFLLWLVAGFGLFALVQIGGRPGQVVAMLLLTLLELVPWSLLIVAQLPELRVNEALLLLWPTDWLLLWPRVRRSYGRIRLAGVLLVVTGKLLGVLVQPLWGILVWVALPLGSVLLMEARRQATDTR